MKKNLILIFIATLTLHSCKEDKIEDVAPTVSCVPTTINYDNNNFTRSFTYNSSGQIIREDVIDNNIPAGHNTYEYSADRLVKQNSYNEQGVLESYYTYEYNASNQLIKETYLDIRNGNPIARDFFTYEYSSPTELKRSSYFYENTLYSYRTYQYSNGLMVKSQSFRADGTLTGRTEIEYDNNKNAVYALNHQLALFGTIGYPFQRNIIKYLVKDTKGEIVNDESYTNVFEYDLNGYPAKRTENKLDGRIRTELYSYNCSN